jgi:serine/threonine-protein kinase
MPAPTTTDQLVTNLRRCGLVPAAALDAALAGVPAGDGPRAVLDRLVASDLLTRFQADRLAAGKYKGFVLGSYVIRDRLGGGGMGQVFLAEHTVMHRLVALKVLAHNGEEGVARERFLREARAAARLRHPNIIGVHDLRTDGPVYYLVMEYIDGLTLQQLVSKGGPVRWPAAADYARQVARGLHHAHEAGLVHRDVKPANLLLDRNGVVRVLDLGLVRSVSDVDSNLTGRLDRAILGTADYLAPEQAVNSSEVDARADVYSLGATLYFMLAGRTLFPDGRTAQKLMWQQMREPAALRDLQPDVPAGLAEVVHRALRKRPEERYPTTGAMAEVLAAWASEAPTPPDPALLPEPPVRPNRRTDGGPSSGGSTPPRAETSTTPIRKPKSRSSHVLPGLPAEPPPTVSERAAATPPSLPPPEPPSTADHTPLPVSVNTPAPTMRMTPIDAPRPAFPRWVVAVAVASGLIAGVVSHLVLPLLTGK